MSPLETAEMLEASVILHKFGASTLVRDCTDIPKEIAETVTRDNIGSLWRARVGRGSPWFYGWCAISALRAALEGR